MRRNTYYIYIYIRRALHTGSRNENNIGSQLDINKKTFTDNFGWQPIFPDLLCIVTNYSLKMSANMDVTMAVHFDVTEYQSENLFRSKIVRYFSCDVKPTNVVLRRNHMLSGWRAVFGFRSERLHKGVITDPEDSNKMADAINLEKQLAFLKQRNHI